MYPKVTVLMTVYNGIPYLEKAIESIIGQTYTNFEFLIVDDCSKDNSKELIISYKDKRIRLIENDRNLGQEESLNIGLSQSRGEYVARIDQDDVSMPDRLSKQVSFLNNHSNIAVVGTWGKFINKNGKITGDFVVPVDEKDIISGIILGGPIPIHPSVMFRKKPVIEQGGYNHDFSCAADYNLWAKLFLKGYKISNIREFSVHYRQHHTQDSIKRKKRQLEDTRRIVYIIQDAISKRMGYKDNETFIKYFASFIIPGDLSWIEDLECCRIGSIFDQIDEFLVRLSRYLDLNIVTLKKECWRRCLRTSLFSLEKGRIKSLRLYLSCLRRINLLWKYRLTYFYPVFFIGGANFLNFVRMMKENAEN